MLVNPDSRLRELAQLCRPGMKWKWRTRREKDGWHADVQCGYERSDFSVWTATADTEEAALDRAVSDAVNYWESVSDRARRLKDGNTGMLDLSTMTDEEVLAIYLDAPDDGQLTEVEQAALDEIERRGLDF